MAYKAEYIWVDGTEPTAKLRSKTKILEDGVKDLPIWGFDGSSHQPGARRQVGLRAPAGVQLPGPDPRRRQHPRHVRGALHRHEAAPDQHPRASAPRWPTKYADQEPIFGIEQEYTFFKDGRPYGFPFGGFPAPQGGYYCGVGADEVYGRDVVEAHMDACLDAGLAPLRHQRRGHARPVGVPDRPGGRPAGGRRAVDRPLAALPHRRGLRRLRHARPEAGEGRLERRRRPHQLLHQGDARGLRRRSSPPARRSATKVEEHVALYGHGIEDRLTGLHETAPYNEYSYGVSDRGASVRIPWQVEVDKKGYIEDRRPNANCDPYDVTTIMIDTICSALA